MNEMILIVLFAVVLIAIRIVVARLKMPARAYVGIASSLLLILLVWVGSGNGQPVYRYVLTGLAGFNLLWELWQLRKFSARGRA